MMKRICYIVTLGRTIDAFFIPQLKHLAENGFDVSVVCTDDNSNLREKLGDSVHFIPMNIPRGIAVIGMVEAIRNLRWLFKREKYDLIQYSTPNAAFCSAIAGKQAGIQKRNYHLMGLRYLGENGILKKVLKEIEKATCSLSTSIECVSHSNLKMAIEDGLFPAEKGTVVWNGSSGGVDLTYFDYKKRNVYRKEIRRKHGLSDEDFVFGFVGRITRDKGINEILDAYYQLSQGKLLMVGGIEGEESLNHALFHRSKEDSNIIYAGHVTEVEKYYCAMDVLLLPSYREGFGNVVIEAAAMGTPAIVSNIPGPIDAIEKGVTAYTVEPKNSLDLKAKMERIMRGDYQQMGVSALKYVETHFDSRILCEKIVDRKINLIGAQTY